MNVPRIPVPRTLVSASLAPVAVPLALVAAAPLASHAQDPVPSRSGAEERAARESAEQRVAHEVRLDEFGLAFEVPGAWEAMPGPVVRELADTVSTLTGEKVEYAAGFQIGPFERWLQYPYALVQVRDVGREVEAEALLEMWRAHGGRVVQRTASRLDESGLMRDVEVGELVWEAAAGLFWMPISSTVANVGRVQGVTGWRPYERGLLMLHVYAPPAGDLESLQATAREVLRSARLDPAFASRSSAGAGIRWAGALEKGLIVALVGAAVGFASARLRGSGEPEAAG